MKTYSQIENDEQILDLYTYQSNLTKKLKNTSSGTLNQEWVNEVVLWKLNRYVEMDDSTLALLNDARLLLPEIDRSFTRLVLKALLKTQGAITIFLHIVITERKASK